MLMKNWTKFVGAIVVMLAVAGCGDKEDTRTPPPETDATQWVLKTVDGSALLADKVYLDFRADGTFAIYQNINALGFKTFSGTYRIDETSAGGAKVLSGAYSGGAALKESYEVVGLSAGSRTLRMTGRTTGEVSLFDATVIPDYVRESIDGGRAADRSSEMPFL